MNKGVSFDHFSRSSGVGGSDCLTRWRSPRAEPEELRWAREAMDQHRLADAERHLQRALVSGPECAAVRTLLGLLHEQVGEHHAAYRCFRLALMLDPRDATAGDGLSRYCQRFGHDPANQAINPAASNSPE
jgi:Tfp pilus assembly protein PilF